MKDPNYKGLETLGITLKNLVGPEQWGLQKRYGARAVDFSTKENKHRYCTMQVWGYISDRGIDDRPRLELAAFPAGHKRGSPFSKKSAFKAGQVYILENEALARRVAGLRRSLSRTIRRRKLQNFLRRYVQDLSATIQPSNRNGTESNETEVVESG